MTARPSTPSHLEDLVDLAARAIIPTLNRLADLEIRGTEEDPVCFVRDCQRHGTKDTTVAIFRHPEDVKLTTYRIELCGPHAERWASRYIDDQLDFAGVSVVGFTYAARR